MPSSHEQEVERWRAGRLRRLTGPDGWLSLVGLAWLHEGPNSIGSDPRSDVVLPGGKAPAGLGTIELRDGRATLRADPDAELQHEGRPIRAALELRDDAGGAEPTVVTLGSLSFQLIRRDDALAVRVRDSENPARDGFRGIEHFPVDPRWRVEARFEPYDPPGVARAPTILGSEETYAVPGALAFRVGDAELRLEPFLEPGETDLFIVFGDLTNRSDTYEGGRYLYAEPPGPDGTVVLDFNRAYNPPCVFTPYATCALPLPENRLPIRVEAGEKRYRPNGPPGSTG